MSHSNKTVAVALFYAVLCVWYPRDLRSSPDDAPRVGDGTSEARIELLESAIRVLEARIRELEARQTEGPAAVTADLEPTPAEPEASPGRIQSFFEGVVFSGFADAYYGFNFNRPASRRNALRNFDFNHNQFSLNLLEIALERAPAPAGFRVDFNLGDATKWVHGSEPGGSDVYQYLQQAYVSYKAPLGKGLTVDFGKFVTHMGAELIETHANMNYSRSLLFSWTIPYYHFGARISYMVHPKVSVSGLVVNGWNSVVDNNGGKSAGLSVNVTPHPRINLIQNYIIGAEQPDNSRDRRQVLDSVLTVAATDRLTLMANYDYGFDRVAGERVRFQGVAGYLRYAFNSGFALASRIEWLADPQGFATGLNQTLREATLTGEFKLNPGVVLRAEYRHDRSNRMFFEKRDGLLSRSQRTAALGLIYLLGQER